MQTSLPPARAALFALALPLAAAASEPVTFRAGAGGSLGAFVPGPSVTFHASARAADR